MHWSKLFAIFAPICTNYYKVSPVHFARATHRVCIFHSIQSCCILCCVCSHWRDHLSRMSCHWHMPCLSILGSCHLGRYNSSATTHQRRQHLIQGYGSGKRVLLCTFSLQLNINDQVWFSTNFKVALRCSFAQTYYIDTRAQVWEKGSMNGQAKNMWEKGKKNGLHKLGNNSIILMANK